jgi:hypothetical protein
MLVNERGMCDLEIFLTVKFQNQHEIGNNNKS